MADAAKTGRFTMLEAKGPNNPPAGSEAWPVAELANAARFTILEPRAAVQGGFPADDPPPRPLAEPVQREAERVAAALAELLRVVEPVDRFAVVAFILNRTQAIKSSARDEAGKPRPALH
jgi:hypothetical protein